jgi:hypothetical protein
MEIAERREPAELARAGYLVLHARADVPTVQARSGDTAQRDAALASGAQFVRTDYPEPSPFGSGYVVELPGGGAALQPGERATGVPHGAVRARLARREAGLKRIP